MSNLFNQYLPQSQPVPSNQSCSSTHLVERLLGDMGALREQVSALQEIVIDSAVKASQNTATNPPSPEPADLPSESTDIRSPPPVADADNPELSETRPEAPKHKKQRKRKNSDLVKNQPTVPRQGSRKVQPWLSSTQCNVGAQNTPT